MYSDGAGVVSTIYEKAAADGLTDWFSRDRLVFSTYPDHYSNTISGFQRVDHYVLYVKI